MNIEHALSFENIKKDHYLAPEITFYICTCTYIGKSCLVDFLHIKHII